MSDKQELMRGFVKEVSMRFHFPSFCVVIALGELIKGILKPSTKSIHKIGSYNHKH